MARSKRGARARQDEEEDEEAVEAVKDEDDEDEDDDDDDEEQSTTRRSKTTKAKRAVPQLGDGSGALAFNAFIDPLTGAWEPDPVDSSIDIATEVVTDKDESRAASLAPEEVKKLVTRMTRYCLFRGSKKLPIFKPKLGDAVMGDYKKARVTTFVLGETQKLLRGVWGLDLVPAPAKNANEDFKGQHKDAFYLVYSKKHMTPAHASLLAPDDDDQELAERGLLLFTFSCVASTQEWKIREKELFKLLQRLDPDGDVPDEPRAPAADKRNRVKGLGNIVDLFDKFVHQGYLVKFRDAQDEVLYELGPRALVDVGRNQILQFQADALGQTLDMAIVNEMQDNAKPDDDEDDDDEDDDGDAPKKKGSKRKTTQDDDDDAPTTTKSSSKKPSKKSKKQSQDEDDEEEEEEEPVGKKKTAKKPTARKSGSSRK